MYTKGNWYWEKDDKGYHHNLRAKTTHPSGCEENCHILFVAKDYLGEDSLEEANAQLISATPDLYEALKGILPELREYVQEVGDCDHSVGICFCGLFNKIDNIEQALAKAEGK